MDIFVYLLQVCLHLYIFFVFTLSISTTNNLLEIMEVKSELWHKPIGKLKQIGTHWNTQQVLT